jgi:hypothetical protein
MKCLEITLTAGKTLHIPPYWWYSIKFGKNASISCFRYRTYMNNVVILPHFAMYALQIQNIKRDVVKKHDIKILNYNKEDADNKRGENEDENENEDEKINSQNTTKIDDLDIIVESENNIITI